MGWNAGYTVMERSVLSVYDAGCLNPKTLDALMEPFKNTDCDSGGSYGLRARDGKSVEEVIACVMEPEKYRDVVDDPAWYEGEEPGTPTHDPWTSNSKAHDLFWSIWNDLWGIC